MNILACAVLALTAFGQNEKPEKPNLKDGRPVLCRLTQPQTELGDLEAFLFVPSVDWPEMGEALLFTKSKKGLWQPEPSRIATTPIPGFIATREPQVDWSAPENQSRCWVKSGNHYQIWYDEVPRDLDGNARLTYRPNREQNPNPPEGCFSLWADILLEASLNCGHF